MPIIINKKDKELPKKVVEQTLKTPMAVKNLRAKEKKTKYHLLRKDRTHEDYKGIRLFVDGEEMELSDSSKFILEQLIKDEQ